MKKNRNIRIPFNIKTISFFQNKKSLVIFSELLISHLIVAVVGFAIGLYVLPILTAPAPPPMEIVNATIEKSLFHGTFQRNLKDSDFLHWGDGEIWVSTDSVAMIGKLSPGPDYRLYLSPVYVETEDDFNRLKYQMTEIGDIKNFDGFVLPIRPNIDILRYNSFVIWCEAFDQFISAARYR